MLYVGVEETSVRWAIEHVRAGAEEAGRDPDAVKLSVLTAMWVGDDQEEAWDKCRWAPGRLREPHRRHDAPQPGPRHAGDDDAAARRAATTTTTTRATSRRRPITPPT